MPEYVIGVDGGNSKTDVVIVSVTGRVLARVRGGGVVSPSADPAAWREHLVSLVDQARREARIPLASKASAGVYYLANVDIPEEIRLARRELQAAGASTLVEVGNDTMAVLRAGSTRLWGIAVASGAGINAVGVHPSGRRAGFLALGDISGDRGGGLQIGIAGLGAAVREQDGRGPATALSRTVPAFFGLRKPEDVSVALLKGTVAHDDLLRLAPLVFAAATAGDAAALRILAEFADEVVTMAGALLRRLHLTRTDVEVVLGGGSLQTGDPWVFGRIATGVTAIAPDAQVSVLDVPPVFGAVAEALHLAGARPSAIARTRTALLT
jgi:N-acetylglucosamine kinase-like BadF-type ATPase